MSKHKLYMPDAGSPISLGMSDSQQTPKENDNQSNKSETCKTSEQGLKRKYPMIKPVTVKLIKRELYGPVSGIENRSEKSGNANHPAFVSNSETSKPSTSKDSKLETEPIAVQKFDTESLGSAAPFDDFDADDSDYIYSSNLKIPYSYKEDEMILKFVLKGQNIFRVSSLSLWRHLESKKSNPKRTYQSLKNRFLRNIKPNLFTTYQHLINDNDIIEKLLIKFPELKTQKETQRFLLKSKSPVSDKKDGILATLKSDSHECEINKESRQKAEIPVFNSKPDTFDPSILESPYLKSPEKPVERTVKISGNSVKVFLNLEKSKLEIPFSSRGLSERFKNLRKNTERVPCHTCGRFYRRPTSNASSETDAESDILIPDSVETEKEKNPETNDISVSKKSPEDLPNRKISLRSYSSLNNSGSQNLADCLEKSDKSEETSEGCNSVLEIVTDEEDGQELIEPKENEKKSEVEDKNADSDSDIDLIYEHTAARFKKLIDADEEKTLQRKCLNKDRDSIGFNANTEKNLDSFFLDTQVEVETPALTEDFPTQVEISNVKTVEVSENSKTQSQRITRSSTLASNMMKMLRSRTEKEKKSQK